MTRHFARVIAAGPVLVSEWNAGSLSDPADFGPYQRSKSEQKIGKRT
jgi:hypothetical protein